MIHLRNCLLLAPLFVLQFGCGYIGHPNLDPQPLQPDLVDIPPLPELPAGTVRDDGILVQEVDLGIPEDQPGSADRIRVYSPTNIGDEKLPCLIVVPGGASEFTGIELEQFDDSITEKFVEAGFVVVVHEVDGYIEIDEDLKEFDLRLAARKFLASHAGLVNARNAVEFAITKVPQVDPQKLYTFGHDTGGSHALRLAAFDDRIDACCVAAPFSSISPSDEKRIKTDFRLGTPVLELLRVLAPETYIATMNCPVYIAHGDSDASIPIGNTSIFVHSLRRAGGNVRYLQAAEANHKSIVGEALHVGIPWLRNLAGLRGRPYGTSAQVDSTPDRRQLELETELFGEGSQCKGFVRRGTDFVIRDAALLPSRNTLVLSGHPTGPVAFKLEDIVAGRMAPDQMRMDDAISARLTVDNDTVYYRTSEGVALAWDAKGVHADEVQTIPDELREPSHRQYKARLAYHAHREEADSDEDWDDEDWDDEDEDGDEVELDDESNDDTGVTETEPETIPELRLKSLRDGNRQLVSLIDSPGFETLGISEQLLSDGLPKELKGLFYVFRDGKAGLFYHLRNIELRGMSNGRLLGAELFLSQDSTPNAKPNLEENRLLTSGVESKGPYLNRRRMILFGRTKLMLDVEPIAAEEDAVSGVRRELRAERRGDIPRDEIWYEAAEPFALTEPNSDRAIVVTPDSISFVDPSNYPAPICEAPSPYQVTYPDPVRFTVPPGAELVSVTRDGIPFEPEPDAPSNVLQWSPSIDQVGFGRFEWDLRTEAGIERQVANGVVSLPAQTLPIRATRFDVDEDGNRMIIASNPIDTGKTVYSVLDLDLKPLQRFELLLFTSAIRFQGDTIVVLGEKQKSRSAPKETKLLRIALPESPGDDPKVIAQAALGIRGLSLATIGNKYVAVRARVAANLSGEPDSKQKLYMNQVYRVEGPDLDSLEKAMLPTTNRVVLESDRFIVWEGVLWGGNPKRRLLLCEFPKTTQALTHVSTNDRVMIGGREMIVPHSGDYPNYLAEASIPIMAREHRVTKGTYGIERGGQRANLCFFPIDSPSTPVRVLLDGLSPQATTAAWMKVTKNRVYVFCDRKLVRFDRSLFEKDVPDSTLEILPVQETFTIFGRRLTKLNYRARGAEKLRLQLFATDNLETPVLDLESEDGEFEFSLAKQLDRIRESLFESVRVAASGNSNPTTLDDAVTKSWITSQQASYTLATGKKTKDIPIEMKALLTAESSDGQTRALCHSFIVLAKASELE